MSASSCSTNSYALSGQCAVTDATDKYIKHLMPDLNVDHGKHQLECTYLQALHFATLVQSSCAACITLHAILMQQPRLPLALTRLPCTWLPKLIHDVIYTVLTRLTQGVTCMSLTKLICSVTCTLLTKLTCSVTCMLLIRLIRDVTCTLLT